MSSIQPFQTPLCACSTIASTWSSRRLPHILKPDIQHHSAFSLSLSGKDGERIGDTLRTPGVWYGNDVKNDHGTGPEAALEPAVVPEAVYTVRGLLQSFSGSRDVHRF